MSRYFSNGTEHRAWSALWCDRCVNDHPAHVGDYEDGCALILDSMTCKNGEVDGWHLDADKFGFTFPPAVRCDKFAACGPCGETAVLDADGYPSSVQQREFLVMPDGSQRLFTDELLTRPEDPR